MTIFKITEQYIFFKSTFVCIWLNQLILHRHTYAITKTRIHIHHPCPYIHTHIHTHTHTHRGFPRAKAHHPVKQYKSLILVISINSKILKIFPPSFFFLSHYPRYSRGTMLSRLLPKYTKLAAYQLIFLHDPLKILCVCTRALTQHPRPLLPLEET